jgi:hypothetical protein
MRAIALAIWTAGSILALSPSAGAQQRNDGGVGGAIDTLNRAVNPDRDRDTPSRGGQYDGDRPVSGSSRSDDRRGAGDYRSYSDQELRAEAARLQDEQRAINDELRRRDGRR